MFFQKILCRNDKFDAMSYFSERVRGIPQPVQQKTIWQGSTFSKHKENVVKKIFFEQLLLPPTNTIMIYFCSANRRLCHSKSCVQVLFLQPHGVKWWRSWKDFERAPKMEHPRKSRLVLILMLVLELMLMCADAYNDNFDWRLCLHFQFDSGIA